MSKILPHVLHQKLKQPLFIFDCGEFIHTYWQEVNIVVTFSQTSGMVVNWCQQY